VPSHAVPIRAVPRGPYAPAASPLQPRHSVTDASKLPGPRAQRARRRAGGASRILIPLAFVALGVALVYALLHSFMTPPEKTADAKARDTPAPPPPAEPPTPIAFIDPPPPVPPSRFTLTPQEVLKQFIRASSGGARLVFSLPSYETSYLERSPLASAQLRCKRLEPIPTIAGGGDGFVDHYFHADLELDDGHESPVLVAVRSFPDDNTDPKVLIDPLRDLIAGGRLDTFLTGGPRSAEGPPEEETFRVVLEWLPRAFDDEIPGFDPKIRFRIRKTTDTIPEVAVAYVATGNPRLQEFLDTLNGARSQDRKDLKFGDREPATVVLRRHFRPAEAPAPAPPPPADPDPVTVPALEPATAGMPPGVIPMPPAGPPSTAAPEPRPTPAASPPPAVADTPAAGPYFIELVEIKSLDWSPPAEVSPPGSP
jgi:hypothetical protein